METPDFKSMSHAELRAAYKCYKDFFMNYESAEGATYLYETESRLENLKHLRLAGEEMRYRGFIK
jgi:hypothetical protein